MIQKKLITQKIVLKYLLYFFCSADERLREHREARVVVSSNGETLWVPQALFKSTCEVEITYFPFDTQVQIVVFMLVCVYKLIN